MTGAVASSFDSEFENQHAEEPQRKDRSLTSLA